MLGEAIVLENMPSGSAAPARAKPEARSRVTNGKSTFLDTVDGRSVLARRYRDILGQLVSDVGGDPSEAQSILCRRGPAPAAWGHQAQRPPDPAPPPTP